MGEERRPEQVEGRDPEFYEALGRTIQVLRTDQGLDRRDLAGRSGISYSYLAAIENGKKPPSSRVLFALAGALGLHSHELLASAETRFHRFRPDLTAMAAPSRRQAWFHTLEDRSPGSPPAPAGSALARAPHTPAGFMMELDRLNRELSDQDRDLVLGLARHLARVEDHR